MSKHSEFEVAAWEWDDGVARIHLAHEDDVSETQRWALVRVNRYPAPGWGWELTVDFVEACSTEDDEADVRRWVARNEGEISDGYEAVRRAAA